jgi:NlpC/P60 family putative phage cell wall peptidase
MTALLETHDGRSAASAVVAETRLWIGTPYLHAGSLRGVGCDCLGLVRGVWRALYGSEPEDPGPYTADWAEASGEERLADAATRHLAPVPGRTWEAGDLLILRWREGFPAKHLGIATGADTMVHAHDGACVAEVAVGVWRTRVAHVFRFPPLPLQPGNGEERR